MEIISGSAKIVPTPGKKDNINIVGSAKNDNVRITAADVNRGLYDVKLGGGKDTVTIDESSKFSNLTLSPAERDKAGKSYYPLLLRQRGERGAGTSIAMYDVETLKVGSKSINLTDVKAAQKFTFPPK